MINEIMINTSGASDGTGAPNTSEWVELYNACDVAVDVSCFVISDGDFTVTFPAGTSIPPNSYYVLGSNNSGVPVDLNWATCGCTNNSSEVGIFTNGDEQLILIDENGAIQNAIYWGTGQFPATISSAAGNGCSAENITFNAPNFLYEEIPYSNNENCSYSRLCSGDWSETCGVDVTPGAVNGEELVFADLAPSDQEICAGECISFQDLSQGATSWDWTFFGAINTNSTDQNPAAVCYDTPGIYNVQLEITSGCGPATIIYQNMIEVFASELPVIAPAGPVVICEGATEDLTTDAVGNLQWFIDDVAIPGETATSITVDESGIYSVQSTLNQCVNMSAGVNVTVTSAENVAISPAAPEAICEGNSSLLTVTAGFDTYQWLIDGNPIPGATQETYDASTTGNYSVLVTSGICETESDAVPFAVNPIPVVTLSQTGNVAICEDETLVISSTVAFDSYQWLLNGLPIAGETSQQVTISAAGAYSLEATNLGCLGLSEEVNIEVNPVPVLSISPEENVVTCNSGAFLEATTTGDIQWYLDGAPIPGETNPVITVTEDGDYYFVSDINDFCPKVSDWINVALNVELELDLVASADSACEGDLVTIQAIGNFSTISWNNSQTIATIMADQTGDYIATATDGQCVAIDTIAIFIGAYPEVDAGEDFYSSCEDALQLFGKSSGAAHWEINEVLVANGDTVLVTSPTKTTEYVLVSELENCIAKDTVVVTVDCVFIFAPNAFTPDGDGLNDIFKVYVKGVPQYILRIYNRWGALVFETDDPEKVWTGGAPDYYVPDDIYVWKIEALDENYNTVLDKEHSTGTVMVIR